MGKYLTQSELIFARELGKLVKKKRRGLKLTQTMLANRIGVDRSMIYRHEVGENRMSLQVAMQFIQAGLFTQQELFFVMSEFAGHKNDKVLRTLK